MSRDSDEKKMIMKAMRSFLELNHLLQGGKRREFVEDGDNDGWPDEIVNQMASLLNLVIPSFSPCLFDRVRGMFYFRTRSTRLSIGEEDIVSLRTMDEAIHIDIQGNRFKPPLRIMRIGHEVFCPEDAKELAKKPLAKLIPHPIFKLPVECKVVDYASDDDDVIAIDNPPPYYETYVVEEQRNSKGFSAFHDWMKPIFYESGFQIGSPRDGVQTSFENLIRYLFVKYVFLVGSFERIKVCPVCSRIFHETKSGYRKFCSKECRRTFHDLSEPEVKSLCRDRQNHWIRNRVDSIEGAYRPNDKPESVPKEDCASCNENGPKGGACSSLKSRNKKLLEAIRLYSLQ